MMGLAPEAIFNPYFVPPELLFRDAEKDLLKKMLEDSLEDNYSINIVITGHNGVGKTVLGNYTTRKELNAKNETYFVDVTYLTPQEIFEGFALSLGVPPAETAISTFSKIEKYTKTKPGEIVLFLDNINQRNMKFYRKFVRKAKQAKITTITTMTYNTYNAIKKIKLERDFLDVTLQLGMYTERQLVEIAKQKVQLAFPVSVQDVLIEYMTDIVAEFDYTRPGTIVEILRLLYKEMLQGKDINANIIREACYELGLEGDNLFLIEEMPNLTFLDLVFMEKISQLLIKNPDEPYLDLDNLNYVFYNVISQLNMEYQSSFFKRVIYKLIDLGVLLESKLRPYNYFVIIDPNVLLEVIQHNKLLNNDEF